MTARDVCRRALATLLAHQHVPPRDTEIQEVWPIERSTDGPETLHSTLKHIGQEKDRTGTWTPGSSQMVASRTSLAGQTNYFVFFQQQRSDHRSERLLELYLVDITLSLWPTS